MKRLTIIMILFSIPAGMFAQDFDVPKDYKLEKTDDYAAYEKDVISCVNWLIDSPINTEANKRQQAFVFLLNWIKGSPKVYSEPNIRIVTFGDNPSLLMIFVGAWTRYSLATNDFDDIIAGNMAGIKGVIKFYLKNKDHLKEDNEVEKYIEMMNKGKLEDFIKKNVSLIPLTEYDSIGMDYFTFYDIGIIVTKTGDSIFCQIPILDYYPKRIFIKPFNSSKKKPIKRSDIKCLSMRSNEYENISYIKKKKVTERFMRKDMYGSIELFSYTLDGCYSDYDLWSDEKWQHRYYALSDFVIRKAGQDFYIDPKQFKEIMSSIIQDVPELVNKINNNELSYDNILEIVKQYNVKYTK